MFAIVLGFVMINGPEQVSLPPDGSCTTGLLGRRVMSRQPSTPREELQQKRERLARICAALGESATPAEIRERAYAEGFGYVSPAMLVWVRDRLWPDRERHAGGGRKWTNRAYCVIREEAIKAVAGDHPEPIPACPECGSRNTKSHGPRGAASEGRVIRLRECRACRYRWKSDEPAGKLPGRLIDRVIAATATEKVCASCGRTLPVAEFSGRGDGTIFKRPYCRDCCNRRRSEEWERRFFAGLGIDREEYDRMADAQGHRCAICGCDEGEATRGKPIRARYRWLRVDHCHKTGKVRGLLCDKCNLGIGNFNDDLSLFAKAVEYLQGHQQQAERPGGGV